MPDSGQAECCMLLENAIIFKPAQTSVALGIMHDQAAMREQAVGVGITCPDSYVCQKVGVPCEE